MTKEEKEVVRTFGLSIPLEALQKLKKLGIERDDTVGKIILEALVEWWGPQGHLKHEKGPLLSKTNGTTVEVQVGVDDAGGE